MEHIDEKMYNKLFGERIKYLRKERKLSQSALGGKANLEKTAIQRIERGYNSTLKTLVKLAKALDIPMSELFNFSFEDASIRKDGHINTK